MSSGQIFIIAIIAIATIGGVLKMSIRARHGFHPDDEHGEGLADERKLSLLTSENERLHGKIERLEERIAVLERIATDPAERVSRDIAALR